MLDIGLIGLGPDWETRYRPALQGMRHRIRLRSVYSAVAAQAEPVASEFDCEIALGLRSMIERPDLRALLLLDTAWFDDVPLQMACLASKPVYLASQVLPPTNLWDELQSHAAERGIPLMPEFGHRFTPATNRLRELMASRLGRPVSIRLEACLPPNGDPDSLSQAATHDLLKCLLDWCVSIVGRPPTSMSCGTVQQATRRLLLGFRPSRTAGEVSVAEIHLRPGPQEQNNGSASSQWRCEIECDSGSVVITNPTELFWTQNQQQHSESLAGERSATEVMLDHFSRRVVGGLIPVPTLEDLHSSDRWATAAIDSLRLGNRVDVE